MEIKVFDWEKFERSKIWYVSFISFFVFFILLSIFFNNISWVFLLLLMLWWYLLFSLRSDKIIRLWIYDDWLKIGQKLYSWSDCVWFALEMNDSNQKINNIVIIMKRDKSINTFSDSPENIKEFILKLSDNLDMLSDYEQTFVEKLSRKLKIM